MKRLLFFILGMSTLGLFESCNTLPDIPNDTPEPVAFYEAKHNELFSIQVAGYMYETSEINPYATMVYGNHPEEVFLMVIDDEIEQLKSQDPDVTLNDYFHYATSQFDQPEDPIIEEAQIDGKKAIIYKALGRVNDRSVYYHLAVIEGSTHFYQVVGWTTAENKAKYESDLLKMIHSLQEINPAI